MLDIRSWPGGKGKGSGSAQCWKQALGLYGLTEETAKDFKGNPLDHAEALARAGIPIVASVSAPSTLAMEFARESNQTLIGFLRPPTFNIYSHVERVVLD